MAIPESWAWRNCSQFINSLSINALDGGGESAARANSAIKLAVRCLGRVFINVKKTANRAGPVCFQVKRFTPVFNLGFFCYF